LAVAPASTDPEVAFSLMGLLKTHFVTVSAI
jgi:hypothetical protein